MKHTISYAKPEALFDRVYISADEAFLDDGWLLLRLPLFADIALHVKENENGHRIELTMPGAQKDDISLHMENGGLAIGVEGPGDGRPGDGGPGAMRHGDQLVCSVFLACAEKAVLYVRKENGQVTISVPKKPSDAAWTV